jgi:FAD/FMN-containing dehydrogenase
MAQQLSRQLSPQLPQQSRRGFLRSSAKLTLGLGIGLSSLDWLTGCTQLLDHRPGVWNELAARLQGVLLRPGAANFVEQASPWALQYAATLPQGIAQCRSEADVQACIQWARANNIPLVARSGGHSYGGYSLTTGLMVDVSLMTNFAYDPATGLATVGGGARNRTVFDACKPLGRTIPHGRCFKVGVAGLVLGGGIGFDMRLHGFTCDALRETRIVLADGRALTCNENQNADLFWACRGAGGGNFGIHTSFTFETFPVGTITTFDIKWTKRIAETFSAIQSMTNTAPNSLGIKVGITATKESGKTVLSLSILGQFTGSAADFNTLLAPVLAIQKPAEQTINTLPYWDGQEKISEVGLPDYVHERSRFVKGQLSEEAIQVIITSLLDWPGTSRAAIWKYFLLGGQIDAKSSTDMAFAHRGYSMLSSVELEWNASDDTTLLAKNEQWLANFHNRMEAYTSSHCYQNFIDPSQENYLQAYYGQNLAQLQAVKRKYDPGNLFNYPQSIPV